MSVSVSQACLNGRLLISSVRAFAYIVKKTKQQAVGLPLSYCKINILVSLKFTVLYC